MEKSLLLRIASRGGRAAAGVVRGLAGDVKGLGRRLAANRQSGLAAARSADTARRAWRGQANTAQAVGAALRRTSGDLKRAADQQQRLAAQTKRATSALSAQKKAQAGRDMRRSAMNDVPGLVAASAPLVGSAKMAIDLESAMADVKKVVDFSAYEGGAHNFQGLLVDLAATKIPLKAKELASIAAAGGRLGIAANKLKPFILTTSKMAIAWDMSAEQAGDASAKISNILGLPIEGVERLGDAVNHLSDNTASTAPNLINFLKRSAAAGKAFGLLPTQTLALGNAMVALGKEPEVAARGVNFMLAALQNAPAKSKKFQAALAEMGLDAQDLKSAIAEDAQGALMDFLERVAGLDEGDQMGVLTDLFGTEWSDDLIALVGGLGEYRKALSLVAREANYAGSMQREFAARAATTGNKLVMLGNKFAKEALGFGGGLLPALNSGIDSLGGMLDKLAALRQEWPLLTATIQKSMTYLIAGVAAWKALKIGGKVIGGTAKEVFYGGKALGRRLGLGGRRGKAGAGGSLAGALAGAGATPVFVTNWPGGGLGGGLGPGGTGGKRGSKAQRRSRQAAAAAARRPGPVAARRGGKGLAGLARRGLGLAGGLGSRALSWLGKAGGKVAGAVGLKSLGKLAGKSALKKVPGIGVLAGAAFALERAFAGDLVGAAGEAASGLASLVPGLGTAASLAIDAGLAARDMAGGDAAAAEAPGQAPAPAPPDLARINHELGNMAPAPLGPINITINQPVNASGADAKSLDGVLATSRRELQRLIEETVTELFARQQRRSLGSVGG